MKIVLPCWLVGHEWGEWHHDDNYIKEADMETRKCNREFWYEPRKGDHHGRWHGNVHHQRKWMGKIQ